MSLTVDVLDSQADLPIDVAQARSIVFYVLEKEGVKANEVAVHLISDEQMCSLHGTYFSDPSPTDTISFPVDEAGMSRYRHLGDVFVCPATAVAYTRCAGGDPYAETTLYLVHGLLHLLGYKDREQLEQLRMRAAEKRHLEALEARGLVLAAPSKAKR